MTLPEALALARIRGTVRGFDTEIVARTTTGLSLTAYDITRFYIYGTSRYVNDPSFVSGPSREILLDRTWFMNEGPGRLVNILSFPIVNRIMSGEISYAEGEQLREAAARISVPSTPAADRYSLGYARGLFGNIVGSGLSPAELFIWGQIGFQVYGNVRTDSRGNAEIYNAEIRPGLENFDVDSSSLFAKTVNGVLFNNPDNIADVNQQQVLLRFPASDDSLGRVVGVYGSEDFRRQVPPAWNSRCFLPGTPIAMAIGPDLPIEAIRPGDLVLAFDPARDHGRGTLVPARVTRTFRNTARTILDLRGLRMTPGHVCLTDGGAFETIAGILRRDGTLVGRDGTSVRARTGAAAGSPEDLSVTVLYADPTTGRHRSAIVRAGIPLPAHATPHATLLDALAARGIAPHPDGVLRGPAGARLETCDWPPGRAPLDTPEQRNWVMRSDGHAHVPDWIEGLLAEAAEEHARRPTPAQPLPTGHAPIGAALHPHALLGAAIAGNA